MPFGARRETPTAITSPTRYRAAVPRVMLSVCVVPSFPEIAAIADPGGVCVEGGTIVA